MKLLVFKIFGDLAFFRKFYTTSSPLTFPFPPPPTVRGMIAAILGLKKNEYLEKTRELWIGVKINSPIKKFRLGLNLINTKSSGRRFEPTLIAEKKENKNPRTQIKAEFIKDPSYTLYIASENNLFMKLYELLKEHKTHYTLSLGLSELLADFEFIGCYEAEKLEAAEKIHSVIPVASVKELDLEKISKIGKERIPVHMLPDRTVVKYEDVLFSLDGEKMCGNFWEVFRLPNGEIVYLWEPLKK